jgi:glycosyltransferase involved in cell wall biosynthesis
MPPELESRLRTIKFAQYLAEKGYNVTVFGSSFIHNMDKNLINDNKPFIRRNYGSLNFVHIRTNHYKHNGFLRIYSLILFHLRLCYLKNKFEKPDVIIHVPASPFGNFFYLCAKKLKAKYIVDVLDLWPESFVAFGLINKSNPFLKIAYLFEKWLYSKSDNLIFSMEGGKDYIIDKKWDLGNGGPIDISKVSYINNGVDLKEFDYYKKNYRVEDEDLQNDELFKVIYLGSIRHANDIKQLIDAAKILKPYKKIVFIIYGDGDQRTFLENYCNENGVDNVRFKERWIDPKYVPYVLSKSSLNILNYRQNEIWKYGGSQSKLFQYLASGKPICSNISMGYCLISKYKIGISRQLNADKEYADAIYSIFCLDQKDYNQMCTNARKLATEFDYKLLTDKLIELL